MRWAAELTLLFGGIMLWGHLGVTYARPVPHFSAQSHGASPSGQQRAAQAPSPRNSSKNAPPQGDAGAERRNDDLPGTPPARRPNGHMSPEDRRLLRQHIQDAVRELYSH
ncbi:hypothetical protein [Pandoraea bronchicola]|uniref:Uncharacterized protein n=1 Tax=Pandoraea bronchicola TaxID=2508287 RepID=A0A5E5BPZ4_9BURK|nr:hypothetical protein [Pandoraea bronchicola]VVE87222.1 hypothetical protein PBR20603_01150 [Pandoraea bronchicola]